ncbi:MAG: hypothetical protein WCH13_13925 [Deltaproteobacteria bacterium]
MSTAKAAKATLAMLARREAHGGGQAPAKQARPKVAATATGAPVRDNRLGLRVTEEASQQLAALLYASPGASIADVIEQAIATEYQRRRRDMRPAPEAFKPKRGRPHNRLN